MIDPVSVLSSGFLEASKQFTTYLAFGLTSAVSALVLDQRLALSFEAAIRVLKGTPLSTDEAEVLKPTSLDTLKVPGALIEVPTGTARWLLVGVSFVAGLLAYGAAGSLNNIAVQLGGSPELLQALCLHPGVATGDTVLRYGSAILPATFIAVVAWRDGRRVRALYPVESTAPLLMAYIAAMPYMAIVLQLYRLPC